MNTLPIIPDSAPFTPEQRLWLNGYIAGLVSEASAHGPAVTSKPRLRVPIVYASQSGNSESLAEGFAEKLVAAGFDAPCLGAEDHGEIDLASESYLLLVSSTWGEGDPPDNAVEFWQKLQSDEHPRLEQLQYSVLALGDSNYLDFCAQGKAFDSRLEALGAKRFSNRVDCDTDFEEPAETWFSTVLEELRKNDPEAASENSQTSGAASAVEKEKSGYSKKRPFPAKLIANVPLNASESTRDTRHFAFSLEGSGMSYEVGDVLGVYPRNNSVLADEMVAVLGFSPDDPVMTPDRGGRPLRLALIEDFDIRTLSAKLVGEWATFSDSDFLKDLLAGGDASAMEEFLWGRELIDLIVQHPAKFSNPGDFVGLLRKLGPRLYSISSSPNAHPQEVHLCVAAVRYHSHGRDREGVCSTYLADRVNGDGTVPVFLQSAAHFKLPTDLGTDVIMCGPGTGIAPFRAFLEERAISEANGRNWLFFGNPHESIDFLYRDELLAMREKSVLHRLDLAWSRDSDQKVYVQDRMRESGEELWNWLAGGAHFYVCGDAKRMAKDVDQALHHIAATHGGLGEEGAADFINQLKKEKRYQRDVY